MISEVFKENYSILRTGTDFFVRELDNVIIHQPSYKEISMIGEVGLYTILNIFSINKTEFIEYNLFNEEKSDLVDKVTDFQIFLLLITNDKYAKLLKDFFQIIFYCDEVNFDFEKEKILFTQKIKNNVNYITISKQNFNIIKDILLNMFPIISDTNDDFNPANEEAKRVRERILKGRAKVAALNNEEKEEVIDIIGRYCLILSVGQSLDYEKIINLTIYNIISLYKTYINKRRYEQYTKLILAGGKDIEPVEDWVAKISLNSNN